MTRPTPPPVIESNGNVFADLELPESGELLAKARLASMIASIVEARGLSQAQAARVLGATQPIVSNLSRGRLSGFSLDRLLRFLNALGPRRHTAHRVEPEPREAERVLAGPVASFPECSRARRRDPSSAFLSPARGRADDRGAGMKGRHPLPPRGPLAPDLPPSHRSHPRSPAPRLRSRSAPRANGRRVSRDGRPGGPA